MMLGDALRICLRREHLRRTVVIALVVGTILTLINQLDVILARDATALTWVKGSVNYCVPFVVSNLGLLAGKRAERDRGPWLRRGPPRSWRRSRTRWATLRGEAAVRTL
jgi:hypothetical protein